MLVKLEDVCECSSSNLKQSEVTGNYGEHPIYGAAGQIGNVNFFHQDKPYVAIVKDGAGIGRTMLLPAKSSIIGTMQYLIPKDEIMVEYLYYAVRYMHLERYYTGATIPHIYFKDYKGEEFNLSALDEQKKVVDVLKTVENLIHAGQEELSLLDKLVKSRFVEMFGDLYINNQEYPEYALSVLADIVSGITKGRKTISTDLVEVPYMAVSNVKDGYIDWKTVKTIMATKSEIEQYRLCPEDILMTEGGDPDKLGRGAIIRKPLENCIHQNHIFRVRLMKNRVLPEYFEEYLKNTKSKRYFLKCAKQTTGIASINMGQLKNMPVLVPPMEQQKQFAAFVRQTDKLKLKRENSKTNRTETDGFSPFLLCKKCA